MNQDDEILENCMRCRYVSGFCYDVRCEDHLWKDEHAWVK